MRLKLRSNLFLLILSHNSLEMYWPSDIVTIYEEKPSASVAYKHVNMT